MILKKKVIGIVAMLLAVATIALIKTPEEMLTGVSTELTAKPRIILDAGHGGLTNTIH